MRVPGYVDAIMLSAKNSEAENKIKKAFAYNPIISQKKKFIWSSDSKIFMLFVMGVILMLSAVVLHSLKNLMFGEFHYGDLFIVLSDTFFVLVNINTIGCSRNLNWQFVRNLDPDTLLVSHFFKNMLRPSLWLFRGYEVNVGNYHLPSEERETIERWILEHAPNAKKIVRDPVPEYLYLGKDEDMYGPIKEDDFVKRPAITSFYFPDKDTAFLFALTWG